MTNERTSPSPRSDDDRWNEVTSDAYSEMLQLGLHALETEDDLDPAVLERLRARFSALVTGHQDAALGGSSATG